jgi:hypothetical protein
MEVALKDKESGKQGGKKGKGVKRWLAYIERDAVN